MGTCRRQRRPAAVARLRLAVALTALAPACVAGYCRGGPGSSGGCGAPQALAPDLLSSPGSGLRRLLSIAPPRPPPPPSPHPPPLPPGVPPLPPYLPAPAAPPAAPTCIVGSPSSGCQVRIGVKHCVWIDLSEADALYQLKFGYKCLDISSGFTFAFITGQCLHDSSNREVPATDCFRLTPGVGAGRFVRAYPVESGLILSHVGTGLNFVAGVESAPPLGDGGFSAVWPATPEQTAAEAVLRPALTTCAGVAAEELCVVPDMQRACGCCNSNPADCAAALDELTGANASLALDWYQRAYLVLPVVDSYTFSLASSSRTRLWTSVYIGHPAGIHAGEFAVSMPSLPPSPPAAPEALLALPVQYVLMGVAGSSLFLVLMARLFLCGPSRRRPAPAPAGEVRPPPEVAREPVAKTRPVPATPELRLKGRRAAPRVVPPPTAEQNDDVHGLDAAGHEPSDVGRVKDGVQVLDAAAEEPSEPRPAVTAAASPARKKGEEVGEIERMLAEADNDMELVDDAGVDGSRELLQNGNRDCDVALVQDADTDGDMELLQNADMDKVLGRDSAGGNGRG